VSYDTSGVVPLPYANNLAIVTQETAFTEGHTYRLVMYTDSDASGDWEQVLMNVCGLDIQAIPEPGTLTLLALGSLALFLVRRRC